jgi:hypothetical protein
MTNHELLEQPGGLSRAYQHQAKRTGGCLQVLLHATFVLVFFLVLTLVLIVAIGPLVTIALYTVVTMVFARLARLAVSQSRHERHNRF